jgi:colanic acid/amylovoran biosynthesis protein
MRDRTAEQTLQRLLRSADASAAPRTTRGLRIFVDPSAYHSDDAGDLAMLTVALQRLRMLWPSASILVQTLDQSCIQALDPAAGSIDPFGARGWSADAFLAARSTRRPRSVAVALGVCRWIKRRQPWLTHAVACAALHSARRSSKLLHQYLHAVRTADLVVLSGGGRLNDAFKVESLIRLETLELAQQSGAATALLGQALGPMQDPVLRARAARVLPRVDLIALRESPGSTALLDALRVRPRELIVTGDDAVVLAYQAHRPQLGTALGVNVRVASCCGIDATHVERIRTAARKAAGSVGAALLPITISRHPGAGDEHCAWQPQRARALATFTPDTASPKHALDVLQHCRVVVVGSYHAAVFALSMGVPTVIVAASESYAQTLRGLAHQFGVGCQVESASHPDLVERLQTAIECAWDCAPGTRGALLAAARDQIVAGEAAYERLFELVEARAARRLHHHAARSG